MGENSKIGWCRNTFNPWHGCTRISPGCGGGTPGNLKGGCYAEAFSKRIGLQIWGQDAERRFFGDKHWNEPMLWNKRAEKTGVRERVFCASMADVFEDRDDLVPHRERLWKLIAATPALDWLVLTKRPENIERLGADVLAQCWLGTTVEDNLRAQRRINVLRRAPARLHWLLMEPLLEHVELDDRWLEWLPIAPDEDEASRCLPPIRWIVTGGESGPGARPYDLAWPESIIAQCKRAGTAVFHKQLGSRPVGEWKGDNPPTCHVTDLTVHPNQERVELNRTKGGVWKLNDRKGETMSEWPEHLRVREFPEAQP